MSSLIVSGPLKAVVNSSRLALYYLLFAHGVVLWALLTAGFYVVLVGLAVSFFYCLRGWRDQNGLRLLQVQDDNCLFEYGQGAAQLGRLGTRHFISDFLLVVQVQQLHSRRYRYLVLFRDALNAETFRRLRVLLLFPVAGEPSNSRGIK